MTDECPINPDQKLSKTSRSIPLSSALPVLTLAVAVVTFALDWRADIKKAVSDPFHGRDMDRFLERFQVQQDKHAIEGKTASHQLPDWRPGR